MADSDALGAIARLIMRRRSTDMIGVVIEAISSTVAFGMLIVNIHIHRRVWNADRR